MHDDVDLETGRLQARAGGGLAGTNGLRSLAQHLARWTSAAADRRGEIGPGRPALGPDWVLSAFAPEDDAEALVSRSADAVETIVSGGLEAAQQRFN